MDQTAARGQRWSGLCAAGFYLYFFRWCLSGYFEPGQSRSMQQLQYCDHCIGLLWSWTLDYDIKMKMAVQAAKMSLLHRVLRCLKVRVRSCHPGLGTPPTRAGRSVWGEGCLGISAWTVPSCLISVTWPQISILCTMLSRSDQNSWFHTLFTETSWHDAFITWHKHYTKIFIYNCRLPVAKLLRC